MHHSVMCCMTQCTLSSHIPPHHPTSSSHLIIPPHCPTSPSHIITITPGAVLQLTAIAEEVTSLTPTHMHKLLGKNLAMTVLHTLGNTLLAHVKAGDHHGCTGLVQCVLAWMSTVTQPSMNVVSMHATQVYCAVVCYMWCIVCVASLLSHAFAHQSVNTSGFHDI